MDLQWLEGKQELAGRARASVRVRVSCFWTCHVPPLLMNFAWHLHPFNSVIYSPATNCLEKGWLSFGDANNPKWHIPS